MSNHETGNEDRVIHNVFPIREGMGPMFVFPPGLEKRDYSIQILTWVEGVPTIVKTISGIESKAFGLRLLREIGHDWTYNQNFCGHLRDPDDKTVGILHIFRSTYRVQDLELEEDEETGS